ncbi:hypothetical protein [Bacillus horti]|uniref:Uncharacterized protein n=1 Tax=Caldalkalibacillus horti TaxID=77523 RepID=A0ABT9W042_9BACI|nr:hypothetical protein [Bacillus horti]MDQ0166618.1 hypothetical protein [Bacillus horti]
MNIKKAVLPQLLYPSKGYGSNTSTLIAGVRWWNETYEEASRFTKGGEVLSYHEEIPIRVIDACIDPTPELEVFVNKALQNLAFVNVSIRYLKNNRVIEEKIHVDVSSPHPEDSNINIIGPIKLHTKDLGKESSYYDFSQMSGEGLYEIVVLAYDNNGDYITLRVPFKFINLNSNKEKKHKIEEYYYTLIEGASPLSKKPGTHYRAAGVGILKKSACGSRMMTKPSAPISNPSQYPIIESPLFAPCALLVSPSHQNCFVGDTVSFSFSHGNDSGVALMEVDFDSDKLDQIGERSFLVKEAGVYAFQFTALYNNNQECKSQVVYIEAQHQPIPTRRCGEHISGGQGYANYQFYMGTQAGRVTVTYDFYSAPDNMDIYDSHGNRLATTGYITDTQGSPIVLNYEPSMGNLIVIMNDGVSGSLWEYRISCPVPW